MRLFLAVLLMSSGAFAAPKPTLYRVAVDVYQSGVMMSGSSVIVRDGLIGKIRSSTENGDFTEFSVTPKSVAKDAGVVDIDFEFKQKMQGASSEMKTQMRLHTRKDEIAPMAVGRELHIRIEPL